MIDEFKDFFCRISCFKMHIIVKPRLTATSVIRSPRYYGHFLWPPGKNRYTFSCKKKTLVNTAKFFWVIGDRINGVPR